MPCVAICWVLYISQQIATHLGSRQQSTSINCAEFTDNRPKCASSLEGTHKLPEDGIYVPKYVGAKHQKNENLDAFVGKFINR
jgi:hypothetical protein